MNRRAVLAAASAMLASPAAGQARSSVLRVVPSGDLASLDPSWTTAPSTKNHGYMVYDQIAAVDAEGVPRPQMAEGWQVDPDGRSWTFTLRPGLRFHDGEGVRAADCVASIGRWQVRDGFGQLLASATDALEVLDDRRFRFRLRRPFPRLAAALGKSSASPCFVMPERVAAGDPQRPIADATGSGPFRFLADEWISGAHAAYARHAAYVPRGEPASGIAGGRAPRVDRVAWTVIPDAATAALALRAGEQDYWEQPLHDLLPVLRRDGRLVVAPRSPLGTYALLRFNHLHPPFDDVAMRRAVALALDPGDHLRAVVGNERDAWDECRGFLPCNAPLGDPTGFDPLGPASPEAAREAVRAAGHAGARVVQLVASDNAAISALSQVTAAMLRRIGFAVDYVATDWGTVLRWRNSQEPLERGGWSLFQTTWNGSDILDPAVNTMLRGNGRDGWFGWPSDPVLERLRLAWLEAEDDATQRDAAAALQRQAWRSLPHVPVGSFVQPAAWRRTVTGVFPCPVSAYWNIGKAD